MKFHNNVVHKLMYFSLFLRYFFIPIVLQNLYPYDCVTRVMCIVCNIRIPYHILYCVYLQYRVSHVEVYIIRFNPVKRTHLNFFFLQFHTIIELLFLWSDQQYKKCERLKFRVTGRANCSTIQLVYCYYSTPLNFNLLVYVMLLNYLLAQ